MTNTSKPKARSIKSITAIKEEILYMATCVFSPSQYVSRYNRYFQFAEYISQFKNVKLYTVEVAIGDQEFTVTEAGNPFHLQIRTDKPLWYKENILNILINSLPEDAKKIACVDCDIQWENLNWVEDTLNALDKYPVVQMFSTWQNLDEHDKPTHAPGRSFAHRWVHKTQEPGALGFTGLAWAYRRETLNALGGLIDWGILGSGDCYMANALIGINKSDAGRIDVVKEPHLAKFLVHLDEALDIWIDKAKIHVNGNIGCVYGNVLHFFHGKKSQRGYDWRWTILYKHDIRPLRDLSYREDGLIYIKNPPKGFFDDVTDYFNSRQEDVGLPVELPLAAE